MEKKYYKYIDLIRVTSLIAVLLYHLNILKGGYLAVCSFFVLSGYLSCISFFKKEKISLVKYYKDRLLRIYLPLVIVVFTTITIVSFINKINYLNLKSEVTSILLGYNNFWQLNANLDYFTRNINSPFMHLWYISILVQFDLFFPFIGIALKKISKKYKIIPCIIVGILGVGSIIYFCYSNINNGMMFSYYNTLTRVFSLLFGVLLGLIHTNYKQLVFDNKILKKVIFYLYLPALIILFIFTDVKSGFYQISMILSSLITFRLIDYATSIKDEVTILDKFIKFLSSISYEVYLIQYPLIFIFQYINVKYDFILIIVILFTLSYVFNFSINFKKNHKIARYIVFSFIFLFACFGLYKYLITKDHTKEMKVLKAQLQNNYLAMEERQKEYENKLKIQNEEWQNTLANLESGKEKVAETVSNLSVVGIGDSVMLGAVNGLYEKFPNGYFDGKVSRTDCAAMSILQNLKNSNKLGNPVVFMLGTNGSCGEAVDIKIINMLEDREIFWINVTNNNSVHFNERLESFSKQYPNLHIVDWESKSKNHPEYFVADGIHLTPTGISEFSNTLYDSIYNSYIDKYNKEKSDIINKHKEDLKNKITFYGNDLLLNVFDYIKDDYSESKFNINNYDYQTLKNSIEKSILDDSITNNLVIAFDTSLSLSFEQYKELIELCKDKNLYIISLDKDMVNKIKELKYKSINVIDFYNESNKNINYFMIDKIHLTESGNVRLRELLNENLKKSIK